MLRYLDHGAGGGFVRIWIDEDYARHSEAVLRETDSAMRGCRCHEEASAMNGLVRRRWFLFVVPAVPESVTGFPPMFNGKRVQMRLHVRSPRFR